MGNGKALFYGQQSSGARNQGHSLDTLKACKINLNSWELEVLDKLSQLSAIKLINSWVAKAQMTP